MSQPPKHIYKFGDYLLDGARISLLRRGEAVSLTPKLFDMLMLLVENSGHVVEKEEFAKRLWPDTFVGDEAIAHNIYALRKVLEENGDGQKYIATVPKRGYRFIAEVNELSGDRPATLYALEPSQLAAPATNLSISPGKPITNSRAQGVPMRSAIAHFSGAIVVALVIGLISGFLIFRELSPEPLPRVAAMTQITHSGRVDPWGRLISDGSRLYFLEREGDHWNLAQTSLAGGEIETVAAPFRNTLVLDLSPDTSEFLIASFASRATEMPLWTWPVQGGPPTRVGDLMAFDAAWHPNGRQVVYAKDDGVYLADRDGSHSRIFASVQGRPGRFAWSPDGNLLRFSAFRLNAPGSSMWEIRADGSDLHQWLPHWSDSPGACCGSWSHDGAYFFFMSSRGGSSALWAVREKPGFLRGRDAEPYQLSAGEPVLESPILAGADRHRLYTSASSVKSELVSYAPKSRQFTTILPTSRAAYLSYSRNGEWIAYVAADGVIWRSKPDGSVKTPLTAQPMNATEPAWSPDGKQIAFVDSSLTCEHRLYSVSAEGAAAKELFPGKCGQMDPAWSPDGKELAFADSEVSGANKSSAARIQILDLATNHVSTVPGSEGLRAPSWSPDGRFIAAMGEDYHRLMLFDAHKQKWTQLSQGVVFNGALRWSADQRYLYVQDLLGPEQAIFRYRQSDGKREEVVNFESFIHAGIPRCAFVDLAPDGSLVISLLRNHADVYQLELSWR